MLPTNIDVEGTRLDRIVSAFLADDRPAWETVDYLERGVEAVVFAREGLLDAMADAGWLGVDGVIEWLGQPHTTATSL